MKEIGILEPHYHIKYLYTKAKICKTSQTNVTIFTTQEIYNKLTEYLKNKEDYNFVLKQKNETVHHFLKRVEKICNEKIDILFINTVQKTMKDLPHYLGFNPKCKTILTVHVVNAWFSRKPAIDLRHILLSIDTIISSIFAKIFILPKFDALNVIYPPIKQWIEENTNYKKKIFTLPFGFYEGNINTKSKKDNKISFVVPGQIQEYRRDYDVVMDVFEKLFEKHGAKISLTLLGYPVGSYGKKILKKSKTLEKNGFNIKYYEDFVPENIYNETMKNIDFVLLPIKIKSRGLGMIPEYYGKTKGSAAVFEGINYCKPMIVPYDFNMIQSFETSTLKYNNKTDLEKTLTKMIENKNSITELKKSACKNSKYFSLDALQKYFTEEVLEKF